MGSRLKFVIIQALCANIAYADVTAKGKELIQTQTQIKQVVENIEQIKVREGTLIKRLAEIERQYGKLVRSVASLQQRIQNTREQLKRLRSEIVVQQAEVREQSQGLAGQIRSAYAMGRQERLKLMLNQQDPVRSSRMMVYYGFLNKARLERLKQVKISLQKLAQLQGRRVVEEEKMLSLLNSSQKEKREIADTIAQRNALLVKLRADVKLKTRELTQLKGSERKLKKLILKLQQAMDDFPHDLEPAQPFAKLKGDLAWPINGKLVNRFGSERADSRWDGVLIDAREGLEIKAVTRGRVVFADWLRGYGLLTILDHGDGYMTLYAFTQSLYKDVGDWVEAGDVIATVGKSGGRNHAGLYFGIRKDGKPVNPVEWCKKARNGRVSWLAAG